MSAPGKILTAPNVQVEKKVEYRPRTYTQFIKGLKNKEFPSVIVRPNKDVALFQEENGDYGDVNIAQSEYLWQTLMESDAEVIIDTSQSTSVMENLIVFFFVQSPSASDDSDDPQW